MRLVPRGLALAAPILAVICPITAFSSASQTGGPVDPSLFSRDQGRVEGLIRWGKDVVARATPPRRLDPERGKSEPIRVPGLDEVAAVAGDTVRFALGKRKGLLTLRRETDGRWQDIALPGATTKDGAKLVRLGANGEEVAVAELSGQPPSVTLHYGRGGVWKSVSLPLSKTGAPDQLLFVRGRWLLAYSRGEWGGALRSVGEDGAVTELDPKDDLPVNGIAVARDGRIFVGTGLAHLDGLSAHVGFLDAEWRWTTLARVDNYGKRNVAWNLEPDSLQGIALDERGRLYLLTGSHGVVRVEGGKLVPVTPGWPHQHVYGQGLVIDRDRAFIGTFDGGVLVWKLGTREVKRIAIER